MRDLNSLIDYMLLIIPKEEVKLRNALKEHQKSISSASDDTILFWWNEVGDTLYKYVFSDFRPEIDWQDKLERVWTGDEDQDNLEYSNF